MSCLGECREMGPPPDTILFMPPPPIPAFLHGGLPELAGNGTACASPRLCEALPTQRGHRVVGEFVETARADVADWTPAIGDAWLLVLAASAVGVLLLGALLAMFLLKCREMNDCSPHARPTKHVEQRDCANAAASVGKLAHHAEAVLYHGDNRTVWAALTPRGTRHFVAERYPAAPADDDHYYETVDPRTDYEHDDPTPLIAAYHLTDMERQRLQLQLLGDANADMRCASARRHRLQVSSPTRIEHPNLPPLNLCPRNTLAKQAANGDAMTPPKYGV